MEDFDLDGEVELRSEEVEEILGTPPSWLVRWGTTVALTGFGLLVLVGWMIKYPDVVKDNIILSTAVPPIDIVARTNARIAKFMAEDRKDVRQNQILAVLESTAQYEDILRLDAVVNNLMRAPLDSFAQLAPSRDLRLGDVQTDYAVFLQNYENLLAARRNRNAAAAASANAAGQQIQQAVRLLEADKRRQTQAQQQVDAARREFKKIQQLYEEEGVNRLRFEQERARLEAAEQQYDQIAANVERSERELTSLRRNNSGSAPSSAGFTNDAAVRLRESLSVLRSSIDRWKQNYLLTAPMAGKISLNASFFSAQQYVTAGDLVMTIVPNSSEKIVGRMALKVAGSGKVNPGQPVIIKLESYPHHEFGTLQGVVESKSLAAKDNQYAILVNLPNGLKTSFGRQLPFEQQLQGVGEIITEDKRFLQRVLDQVFSSGR
jgi:multidrug resistance efflux pump